MDAMSLMKDKMKPIIEWGSAILEPSRLSNKTLPLFLQRQQTQKGHTKAVLWILATDDACQLSTSGHAVLVFLETHLFILVLPDTANVCGFDVATGKLYYNGDDVIR